MTPTWDTLAPILRGRDVQTDDVWGVVELHYDFVLGAVRRVVARAPDVVNTFNGSREATLHEAFQWVIERLVRRATSEPRGLPVSERSDGAPGSAPRWFFTVCANLGRDWLKTQRRRLRRETEISDHSPPAVEPQPLVMWDDGALRKLRRLLERPDRAGVPDTHVLAYLCLYRPEAIERDTVVRADAYVPNAGSRSGTPGLIRGVDATWQALQDWRERHADNTFSTAARAELAWILRSDDADDPTTWRERDTRSARTAAVTVGKWAIRCADVLTLPRK